MPDTTTKPKAKEFTVLGFSIKRYLTRAVTCRSQTVTLHVHPELLHGRGRAQQFG